MSDVTISKAAAEGIIDAIKMHEHQRLDFFGDMYSDDQWNGIAALIIALRNAG